MLHWTAEWELATALQSFTLKCYKCSATTLGRSNSTAHIMKCYQISKACFTSQKLISKIVTDTTRNVLITGNHPAMLQFRQWEKGACSCNKLLSINTTWNNYLRKLSVTHHHHHRIKSLACSRHKVPFFIQCPRRILSFGLGYRFTHLDYATGLTFGIVFLEHVTSSSELAYKLTCWNRPHVSSFWTVLKFAVLIRL